MSVSIVIATYNGSQYIAEAIDSVIAQTHTDRELIIINDASTDHTLDIIQDYATRDPRIRYYTNTHNLERSRSRNIGIMHATYDLVAFLDDDDLRSDTDKLANQVHYMHQHPDTVLLGTNVHVTGDDGKTINGWFHIQSGDKHLRSLLIKSNQFMIQSIIARKQALREAGLFNCGTLIIEDYDLWCRMGLIGDINNLTDTFITYRNRTGNTINTGRNRLKMKLRSLRVSLQYYRVYRAHPRSILSQLIALIVPSSRYQLRHSIHTKKTKKTTSTTQ